jgi:ABC-type phosphate/phosphonate transport system substrate-binding protein
MVLLLLALAAAWFAPAAAEQPLIIALTPSRDPTALQQAGDEFAKTIARVSGVPIRAMVAGHASVVGALSRRVDLAFVRPVGYVLANREAGCHLVRDIWQGRRHTRRASLSERGPGSNAWRICAARPSPSSIPRRAQATSTPWSC